ncbi:hypothetical protein J6590_100048 [Homalodisca vitripennis]|nr:hypothetical protein J6590_100048 [Homalodisca vitripennis]
MSPRIKDVATSKSEIENLPDTVGALVDLSRDRDFYSKWKASIVWNGGFLVGASLNHLQI